MNIKEELINLKESFEKDLFDLLQNDEDLFENNTIEELDEIIIQLEEEISKLGTDDDEEEIADQEGDVDDSDLDEKIVKKATQTKLSKSDAATRRKNKVYRRKKKAKLAIAKKKRDIKNKAKLERQKKKNKTAPKGKTYTLDGKLVKKKTRQ